MTLNGLPPKADEKGGCLAEPASPCVGVCRMDPGQGWCAGCFRTLEEIAGWSRYEAATKRVVLRRIAKRRAVD